MLATFWKHSVGHVKPFWQYSTRLIFYYSTNISTFNDKHSTMKFNIQPKNSKLNQKIQYSTKKFNIQQKDSTFNHEIQHSTKKFKIQPKKFNIQPKKFNKKIQHSTKKFNIQP